MSHNLFDNIEENGKNLQQMPSDRAWRKLENRLDGRQGVQRTMVARRKLMAVSVLLLLGVMVGLLVFTQRSTTLSAQKDGATLVAEDLAYTNENVKDIAAFQLQKQFESKDWQPINEGKVGRRLIAVKVNEVHSRASKPSSSRERMKKKATDKTGLAWLNALSFSKNDLIRNFSCRGRDCSLQFQRNVNNTTVAYELTDNTNTKFEFWSTGKSFPEIILLERKGEKYQIKLSGGTVSQAQKNFFIAKGFRALKNGSFVK